MKFIALERLEPYEVKVSRTVLRRGSKSNLASLSDGSLVSQCFLPEPTGSGVRPFV
jgi:hypothetical protein